MRAADNFWVIRFALLQSFLWVVLISGHMEAPIQKHVKFSVLHASGFADFFPMIKFWILADNKPTHFFVRKTTITRICMLF